MSFHVHPYTVVDVERMMHCSQRHSVTIRLSPSWPLDFDFTRIITLGFFNPLPKFTVYGEDIKLQICYIRCPRRSKPHRLVFRDKCQTFQSMYFWGGDRTRPLPVFPEIWWVQKVIYAGSIVISLDPGYQGDAEDFQPERQLIRRLLYSPTGLSIFFFWSCTLLVCFLKKTSVLILGSVPIFQSVLQIGSGVPQNLLLERFQS